MKVRLFTTIEERYCPKSKCNVAMETSHFADGSISQVCLHQHHCNYTNCKSRTKSAICPKE